MPGWSQILEAVSTIGFPCVIALLLFWQLRCLIGERSRLIDLLGNDFKHGMEDITEEMRKVRETLVALLEHFRDGPPPPPVVP